MGILSLEAKFVVADIFGKGHLYLVYQSDIGAAERVIRVGPKDGSILNIGDPMDVESGFLMALSADNRGEDSPEERGNTIIASGSEADRLWDILLKVAQNVDDHDAAYLLPSQNSNTFIRSVVSGNLIE
ncbi:MAG: hypothetical protein Q7T44_18545 [Parvibaculum sp.]|nr:hypothetical protein [Parvibaculum sp.]